MLVPQTPPSSWNRREPIFNLPMIMVILMGGLIGLHLWSHYGMNSWQRAEFFWQYGFMPLFFQAMFHPPEFQDIGDFPFLSVVFSLVSYSFLHGDWLHLGLNLIWLVIFGAPLIRHLDTVRFVLFWIMMAVLSALTHFAFHEHSPVPMIGASGVVSGLMAAAARYGFYRSGEHLLSMRSALMNKSILVFIGVWLAANLAIGFGTFIPAEQETTIAWEAHIGGLIAGFFLIGLFAKRKN